MILDPDTYVCPEHQADLTAQVREALEDDGTPIAYQRSSLLRRGRPGPRPFRVIVTCPGAAGSAAHQLSCGGTWAS